MEQDYEAALEGHLSDPAASHADQADVWVTDIKKSYRNETQSEHITPDI